MFKYEKYLSDIFQRVKKRFPTLQSCQRPKRYVETTKAVIIGYMSSINIHYGSGRSYLSGTLNTIRPLRDHTFHSRVFPYRNQELLLTV
ncbi:hypothetical protein DRB80_04770 [Salmonella enterica]|uniref:Uncharacterized protein n=1 Tax=Salmonella enterica TaxID=28901 RepID=A0A3J5RD29_SALER|nr:hypothetical protein [Salmonella enterica]ECU4768107.1 hypothetical protein [Salmonella enterica subsp. enterica]EAN2271038.1 hypothetical protein [Salmonella enterica]EAN4085690.1 hypothetical protein [Salmonella enterica]EAN4458763.1 hypothetical protein [Salmonella enterica]